jgi:hypothetical protein
MINADKGPSGEFTFTQAMACRLDYYLGGRPDETQLLSGKIHAFEMYSKQNVNDPLPKELAMLISQRQMASDK